MIVKDIRRDFYDIVIREHVLIIANLDVDAVCAFKILQYLFRCDHVSYTLVPVATLNELCRAVSEHAAQVKNVILLNCGGTINLIDAICPPDDVVFFVLDSHRPFCLDCIFDNERIKLIINSEEEAQLSIPAYDEVFEVDENSDQNEDGNEEGSSGNDSDDDLFSPRSSKRRRSSLAPGSRKWEQNRNRVLFDYYEFSYYSHSSAVLLFDLSWKLSKDNGDLLWWACIALTSQFLEAKINLAQYVLHSTDLHQQLQRLNRVMQEEGTGQRDRLKLSFEKDLLLSLYRRWSLFESFRHTVSTACHFKSWTFGGECKLLTFLADLGLPLTQCRQRYSAMDANLRKEVHQAVEDKLEKYGLTELLYVSFSAQYSFGHKISASDAAEAIATALHFGVGNSLESNFLTSLDCLSRTRCSFLYECMGQRKAFLKMLWSEVKTLLSGGGIVPHTSFLLAQLAVGTTGCCYFSKPHGLYLLGHCLLRAFVAQRNGQKHKDKALIIMAPRGGDEGNDWYLVCGIPPTFTLTSGEKPVNCLGQVFRRDAEHIRCRIKFDFFDNFVILLKTEDKDRFCNAISAVLDG